MFIIMLMQVLGLIKLCISAFVPLLAIIILADALVRGSRDFKHRGIRALYRLTLCPLLVLCSNLALPALYELANLLFYMLK